MSPLLRTCLLEILGLYSLWSLIIDLRTGSTTTRGNTVERKDNPGGFYLLQSFKIVFISIAFAVLLNALGLIGDPIVWLYATVPFLMPR